MRGIEEGPRGPIVAKFGGSSLADGERIRQVVEIVQAETDRRYVIVSAPGKRNPEDNKVTDLLLACNSCIEQGMPFDEAFTHVSERFEGIGRELECHSSVVGWLNTVQEGIAQEQTRDWIASRGEWVTAQVFAEFMGGAFVDAARLITLKENGEVDPSTYETMKEQLSPGTVYVIPGFYGKTRDRVIKCFARGGSDITGAVIARGVASQEGNEGVLYENWTDVSGISMVDPRIIPDARLVNEMTYAEIREMGQRGTEVLQMDSILPVAEIGIPINIRNTFNPAHPGTMIVRNRECLPHENIVGIAAKGGFESFQVEKYGMNAQEGIGEAVLKAFHEKGIPFEHVPTGEDEMSVVVSTEAVGGNEQEVMDEIRRGIAPDNISIVTGIGLVSIVGQGIPSRATHINRLLYTALDEAQINVSAQIQRIHGNSIVIAVPEEDISRTVRALYGAFIR